MKDGILVDECLKKLARALKALTKIHPYKYTPRQVLEKAKIIKEKN